MNMSNWGCRNVSRSVKYEKDLLNIKGICHEFNSHYPLGPSPNSKTILKEITINKMLKKISWQWSMNIVWYQLTSNHDDMGNWKYLNQSDMHNSTLNIY